MKIDTVHIKKFRSVEEASIRFGDVSAIVGENNSGKSAIIHALSTVLNYDENETKRYNDGSHSFTPKSKAVITISFVSIPANRELRQYRHQNRIKIQFSHTKKGKQPNLKYYKNGALHEADLSLLTTLKKYINFVYIPPVRNTSELQYAEAAILKKIVEAHLQAETKYKDALSKKFKDAFKFLQNSALAKLAKKLNNDNHLPNGLQLDLAFKEDVHYSDFISDININILESNQSHNLLNCGTGIQSLTIISLYRLLAKLEDKTIFLAIEEPETNLHPHAQKEFISAIKSEAQSTQIAITTHSPSIIDTLGHQDVILVRKLLDNSRGFKSEICQLPETFFEDNGLEAFKYYQFHLYRNSDFFYARTAIVVEAKTDAEIVKILANDCNVDLSLKGCSIINLDGVKNLKYPLLLLKELRIPYLVILDKDFFFPYLNNELSSSRDNFGFPLYKPTYYTKSDIDILLHDENEKEVIRQSFIANHTATLDMLERYNVISMRYTLETDLLKSARAVELVCDELSILPPNKNAKTILTNKSHRKKLKEIDLLMKVTSSLKPTQLPRSFSRIRQCLQKL